MSYLFLGIILGLMACSQQELWYEVSEIPPPYLPVDLDWKRLRQRSVTEAILQSVTFVDEKHGWVVGLNGTILATTDGGQTWKKQNSATDVLLESVNFVDGEHGWVVGFRGTILATTDGGQTWKTQNSGTEKYLNSVAFVNRKRGWIVGSDGTVVSTTDGGQTWEKHDSGTAGWLQCVAFPDEEGGWAFGSGGTILATTDGGRTWTRQSTGSDVYLYSVAFVDGKHGWAVGQGETILATADGGSTWQTRNSSTELEQLSLKSISSVDREHGWAVGDNGMMFVAKLGDSAPYIWRFRESRSTNRNTVFVGSVKDDHKLDSVRCTLEYHVRQQASWSVIQSDVIPKEGELRVVWKPGSGKFPMSPGDPYKYRVILEDNRNQFAQDLNHEFRYQTWWESLHDTTKKALVFLAVLGGYFGLGLLFLSIRPTLFIALLPFKDTLSHKALKVVIELTIVPFFVRHKRTRRAWAKRYQQYPEELEKLPVPIRRIYVQYRDVRAAWIQHFCSGSSALEELSSEIREVFLHHDDTLDAWIEHQVPRVRQEFGAIETVKARRVHVPMPVEIEGRVMSSFSAKDLTLEVAQRRPILICGQGGVGKTSIACEIARWAMAKAAGERIADHVMLPVFLEGELNGVDMLEAVSGRLRTLVGSDDPISSELVDRLLRRGRVLVILDGYSEMTETARKALAPNDASFPLRAWIVTSRREEELDGVPKTIVKPLLVQGNRLSSFMEAYLRQAGKRDLFDDTEFFEACTRLSRTVAKRSATVLLAKLFAELMIASKEEPVNPDLPKNIPDLMLNYLIEVNSKVPSGERLPDRTVHHAAKVCAWECVRSTYQPRAGNQDDMIRALHEEKGVKLLRYLDERLRILTADLGPNRNQVRFQLDPLVEYLAALHMLAEYEGEEEEWKRFFRSLDRVPGAPECVREFLLAVHECCLVEKADSQVPSFVVQELLKLL